MTNDDLVKRLRDTCECDAIRRAAEQWGKKWVGPCDRCQAADAIEALTARLATIEAATVERCAALVERHAVSRPYSPDGYLVLTSIMGNNVGRIYARAIRALAPLDREAMVERVARAMEAELRGRETIIRRADRMHIADVVAGDLERMARAALAAMCHAKE